MRSSAAAPAFSSAARRKIRCVRPPAASVPAAPKESWLGMDIHILTCTQNAAGGSGAEGDFGKHAILVSDGLSPKRVPQFWNSSGARIAKDCANHNREGLRKSQMLILWARLTAHLRI